jgi:DGQHR domain-containing protein
MKKKKKRMLARRLSFPAILIAKKDAVELYVSAVKAKQLFAISAVERAEENPDRGYQRFLNLKRAEDIAKYVDGGNLVPGAIILSAQENAAFTFDPATNFISFLANPRAFLVIDGQHRLYGAHLAQAEIKLPVSILVGLPFVEEARYFSDINTSQKGVPRTLQLAIQKFLTPADSVDQIRLRFFNALNTRPSSPLANRMSATRTVAGKLTLVPFKTAFDPLLKETLFQKLSSDDVREKMLINFLSATEEVLIGELGNSDKLSNAAFFQALFGALPVIMNQVATKHNNFKKESFSDVVKALSEIEWERFNGTNKKVISELTKHIVALVSGTVTVNDDAV